MGKKRLMYIEQSMKKNGYAPSIMHDSKCCYVTQAINTDLAVHEIYHGANRQISKTNGFWCYLIPELHNMSKYGVHTGNTELDLRLKRECQAIYEQKHSRDEFIALIGRSYL